jgi:hypothetical protein
MSESEKSQKISVGFHGGQVLSARIKPNELSKLRKALGSTGWHELTSDDATVALDLSRIDYVLVENGEHRIGF